MLVLNCDFFFVQAHDLPRAISTITAALAAATPAGGGTLSDTDNTVTMAKNLLSDLRTAVDEEEEERERLQRELDAADSEQQTVSEAGPADTGFGLLPYLAPRFHVLAENAQALAFGRTIADTSRDRSENWTLTLCKGLEVSRLFLRVMITNRWVRSFDSFAAPVSRSMLCPWFQIIDFGFGNFVVELEQIKKQQRRQESEKELERHQVRRCCHFVPQSFELHVH